MLSWGLVFFSFLGRWLEERIYRTRAGNEPGGVWARRAVWDHGVQTAGGRRRWTEGDHGCVVRRRARCILDRSKIQGWGGSRLAKMTDEEEELGTDQVPADAMRSTPPWQAEPERKEAMRSRRLTLRSVVARSEHLRYRIWLSNGLILYCFSMFVVRRRMWYFW